MGGKSQVNLKSRQKTVFVASFAGLAGILFAIWVTVYRHPKIDVGVLDWNLARGPQSDIFKENLSEPFLAFIENGAFVNRLAKEITFSEGEGRVTLRDGVLWSDETRLQVQQVVDAWNRFVDYPWKPGHLSPKEERWKKTLSVVADGRENFIIKGVESESELHEILAGYLIAPVRLDLLVEPNKSISGHVTLGRYKLQGGVASLEENDEIKLGINPYYYRGRESAEKVMKRGGDGLYR